MTNERLIALMINVARWIENGCDPAQASIELRIMAKNLQATPSEPLEVSINNELNYLRAALRDANATIERKDMALIELHRASQPPFPDGERDIVEALDDRGDDLSVRAARYIRLKQHMLAGRESAIRHMAASHMAASTPPPSAVTHPMLDVLAICDAYESGIGQGLKNRPIVAYQNPYDPMHEPRAARAYGIGYDEGAKRASQTKEGGGHV